MAPEMQQPIGQGWNRFGPGGPTGFRFFVPESGGWIYTIVSPNRDPFRQGTEEPFYVPDMAVWVSAIASAIGPQGGDGPQILATLQQILALLTKNQNKISPQLTQIDADIKELISVQGSGLFTEVEKVFVSLQAIIQQGQSDSGVLQTIATKLAAVLAILRDQFVPSKIVLDFAGATSVAQQRPTRPGP